MNYIFFLYIFESIMPRVKNWVFYFLEKKRKIFVLRIKETEKKKTMNDLRKFRGGFWYFFVFMGKNFKQCDLWNFFFFYFLGIFKLISSVTFQFFSWYINSALDEERFLKSKLFFIHRSIIDWNILCFVFNILFKDFYLFFVFLGIE